MPTYYASELEQLGGTYASALALDVEELKKAVAGASQSSLICVGSGGSYTVATLLCGLHEAFTGRVSRPSTPLEIISNPSLASTSPAFFISAEGKNPDIVQALLRARQHSARTIHVITNRGTSPLCEAAKLFSDVRQHVFDLRQKDGFLATNSLLMDAVLVARAYGELDRSDSLPKTAGLLELRSSTIADWASSLDSFANEAVKRRGLIVLYSPSLRAIATDLESKLSESALLYTQLADLRSFAHGRHLWIDQRPTDCAILAMVDSSLGDLWTHTRSLIPSNIPCAELPIGAPSPGNLIAALVAELHLVSLIANHSAKDPGRPNIPAFAQKLYYADIASLVQKPSESDSENGVGEKFEAACVRWPYVNYRSPMVRARDGYRDELRGQKFRAIVFDYDGTLCRSQEGNSAPPSDVATKICALTAGGTRVAVVSGRGSSMRDELRSVIPESEWSKIQLGLYNGGYLTNLRSDDSPQTETSEFLNHVLRIANGLKAMGVPIKKISATPPFQVSIRYLEGVDTELMWFVVADALRQAGLQHSAIVRSRHSIDVLAPGVDKTKLVARLLQLYRVLPHELLTVGDQGAWPGNDYALLEHRFSLSVDFSSRRIDRGWKLAPSHKRGVDATEWYLERMKLASDGAFQMVFE